MRRTRRQKNFLWTVLIIGAALWTIPQTSEARYNYQNWFGWDSGWDDWDSWGNTSSSQDVYTYRWLGQDHVIQNDFNSTNYVPQPSQTYEQNSVTDWNNTGVNAPLWYDQTVVLDDPYSGYGSSSYDNTSEYSYNYGDYAAPQPYAPDYDDWFGSGTPVDTSSGYMGPLPVSAFVDGFVGYAQNSTLDCETRSAIDLARFFGVEIDHDEFLASLPRSDDPNLGFVGDPNGMRGQLPPASYGVYEEPVADLLRYYGVNAIGVTGMSIEALKAQIAAGRPVMVWVSGNTELGYSSSYTPSNGHTTQVVPYQHTVIVIGYDADTVQLQDGAERYYRSWNTFEGSWNTLNNRAIYIGY